MSVYSITIVYIYIFIDIYIYLYIDESEVNGTEFCSELN